MRWRMAAVAGLLLTTACGTPVTEPVPAPGVPEQLVAITRDRRLVLVDVATGEELRVLATGDDPGDFGGADQEPVAAGSFLDSVAVDSHSGTVYLSVCCEPAPGSLHTLPLAGGERQPLGVGYDPAVSPDGTATAVVAMQWLTVLAPDGQVLHRIEAAAEMPMAVARPAWSPDGRLLAFEHLEDSLAAPEVRLVEADAQGMQAARALPGAEAGMPWSSPVFDRLGRLLVAAQPRTAGGPAGPGAQLTVDPDSGEVIERREVAEGIVRHSFDRGGAHLLTVLADGRLRWFAADGSSGEVAGDFLAAAW